jgi:selenocysteine lyase/cysteine desulfurase
MTLEAHIRKFREGISLIRSDIFLNHAETSPMMKPVASAMKSYLDEKFQARDTARFIEQGCPRALLARLIGASEHEICYAPNTSYGINVAANSLPIQSGRNVVLWEFDFPGNLYPWLRQRSRGAQIRWAKLGNGTIDTQVLEEEVDDRTVVVAISHVNWVNGFRTNLREISEMLHKRGALLFVDATQSAGAMQIDVKRMGIDILACAFYKWLMGPSGAGFLYVREDLVEKLEPSFLGWNAVKNTGPPSYLFNPREIVLQDHARRYLMGSLSPIPFLGAGVALGMLLDAGIEAIEGRILDLTDRLIEGASRIGVEVVSPRARERRGGIVNLETPRPEEVCARLLKKGMWVSPRSQVGIGGIRVSPHFYNTEREIDLFLSELNRIVGSNSS